MKRCKHCKMNVNSERVTCPLCYNSLIEDNETKMEFKLYPHRPNTKQKLNLFYKVVVFICILTTLITALINALTYDDVTGCWCLYAILSCAYVYYLIRGTILTHTNVIRRIWRQLLTVSLVLFAFDILSSEVRWSLGIVIPMLCGATNIAITITNLANHKHFRSGFVSVLLALLLGVIPLIVYIFKVDMVVYLWGPIVSASISLAIFLGMIIFASKPMKEEFNKRLHV